MLGNRGQKFRLRVAGLALAALAGQAGLIYAQQGQRFWDSNPRRGATLPGSVYNGGQTAPAARGVAAPAANGAPANGAATIQQVSAPQVQPGSASQGAAPAAGRPAQKSEIQRQLELLYEQDGREAPDMTFDAAMESLPQPAKPQAGQNGNGFNRIPTTRPNAGAEVIAPNGNPGGAAPPATLPSEGASSTAKPAPKPGPVSGFFKRLLPGSKKPAPAVEAGVGPSATTAPPPDSSPNRNAAVVPSSASNAASKAPAPAPGIDELDEDDDDLPSSPVNAPAIGVPAPATTGLSNTAAPISALPSPTATLSAPATPNGVPATGPSVIRTAPTPLPTLPQPLPQVPAATSPAIPATGLRSTNSPLPAAPAQPTTGLQNQVRPLIVPNQLPGTGTKPTVTPNRFTPQPGAIVTTPETNTLRGKNNVVAKPPVTFTATPKKEAELDFQLPIPADKKAQGVGVEENEGKNAASAGSGWGPASSGAPIEQPTRSPAPATSTEPVDDFSDPFAEEGAAIERPIETPPTQVAEAEESPFIGKTLEAEEPVNLALPFPPAETEDAPADVQLPPPPDKTSGNGEAIPGLKLPEAASDDEDLDELEELAEEAKQAVGGLNKATAPGAEVASEPMPAPQEFVVEEGDHSIPPSVKQPVLLPPGVDPRMAQILEREGVKGLKGFCPVSLRNARDLIDSKKEFSATYRGQKFQFASEDAKVKFELDPARYAPAAFGADVVTLANDKDVIEGSLDYAAWYKGQLYLFASQANHDLFVSDPVTFASPAGLE